MDFDTPGFLFDYQDHAAQLKRRQPVRLPDDKVRNESHMLRLLEEGVYHRGDLVDAVSSLGIDTRDDGHGRYPGNGHIKFQHRIDNALQHEKASKRALSLGEGYWYLEGTLAKPEAATFLVVGERTDITLLLGSAGEIARKINRPVDLIFCDPPWQMGVGVDGADYNGKVYSRRDRSLVLGGYVDVDPAVDYLDFSLEWMQRAVQSLRHGGHVAVVTGPDQAGDVQRAGKLCGLRLQNSLVVMRNSFVAQTSKRFALSHIRVTVLSSGPEYLKTRTFNHLDSFPKTAAGDSYPLDVITDIGQYARKGLLRNANALNPLLVDRMVQIYTNPGDTVVDYFGGSHTTSLVCLLRGRACVSSDVSPSSVQFGMARHLDVINNQLRSDLHFTHTGSHLSSLQLSGLSL